LAISSTRELVLERSPQRALHVGATACGPHLAQMGSAATLGYTRGVSQRGLHRTVTRSLLVGSMQRPSRLVMGFRCGMARSGRTSRHNNPLGLVVHTLCMR